MFERLWCLPDPEPRTGPLNMALDERMLEFAAANFTPALRTYRWSEPCISIGYFNRIDAIEARFPGRPIVRRWTGGGAVDHRADFTFALAVPAGHALAQRPAERRYCDIHQAVARALKQCGIATDSASSAQPVARGAAPLACFDSAVNDDLMVGVQKVVGGAQRRTRLGVLHQGSVQTPALPVDWFAFGSALASAFGLEQIPMRSTTEFLDQASELATSKYGTRAWQRAR